MNWGAGACSTADACIACAASSSMRGRGADFGVLLVGLWLLTQLSPGIAAVRQRRPAPTARPAAGAAYSAEALRRPETLIAAAGLLAAGLVGWSLLLRAPRTLLTLLLLAPLVKRPSPCGADGAGAALGWITPGNSLGSAAALPLWWSATFLGRRWQRAVAALALLLATVMVNVAPENPYLHRMLQIWNPGQFLNFNGLTRLVSSLWPFLPCPG
jgi:hypothetical protein